MKNELDKLVAEKRKNFLPEDAMITNEHLANLKLAPKQIQKLIMQHPSPSKYSNNKYNMLNAVLSQENYKQQRRKVQQLQDKVLKFTQEHQTFQLDNIQPARVRGKLSPDMQDHMVLGSSPVSKI
jgi:hypothetical protein